MILIPYNLREKVLPSSDVPVIKMEKFETRQVIDENGISHSSVVPSNEGAVLDLPFRSFSMESYNLTGEISRLQFMSPKHVTTFDVVDRISDDLSEISAKVDHMSMLQKVASSTRDNSSDVSNS